MIRSFLPALLVVLVFVEFSVGRQAFVRHQPIHHNFGLTTGCSFNVNTDFGNPSPLPIQPEQLEIISPNADGDLQIGANKTVYLLCSDHLFAARCLHDQSVDVTDVTAGISTSHNSNLKESTTLAELSCSAYAKTSVQVDRVDGDVKNASVGFALPNGRLIGLFQLAYDTGRERSLFAHHQLGSGIANAQLPDSRIAFRKDGLFAADQHLYERQAQRATICDQILRVSGDQCDRYFGTAQKFLARGHLAPSGDFEYRAEQRSTFSLANCAPQWQSINNGNWKAIETSVRKLAVTRRFGAGGLDIVTGTVGTLQLPNGDGDLTNVSLDTTGKIPVPEWFYKIVLDRPGKRGVVFVVANNPTLGGEMEPVKLCSDVGAKLSWAELGPKTGQRMDKGYWYACEVAEFVGNASVRLPQFLLNEKYELLL